MITNLTVISNAERNLTIPCPCWYVVKQSVWRTNKLELQFVSDSGLLVKKTNKGEGNNKKLQDVFWLKAKGEVIEYSKPYKILCNTLKS